VKETKKILLLSLPPALKSALEEQLAGCVLASDPGDGPFDLVIGGRGTFKPGDFPGCPALEAPPPPLRLGDLLRDIGRMLAEPALYLADIPVGRWTFRPQARVLEDGATTVELTDREADMLAYLARDPARAVPRDDLLRRVWRYQDGVDTHTLETHIHRLRRKTGQDDIIVTDAGGYRLCPAPGKE
jgi:hypothetical protein